MLLLRKPFCQLQRQCSICSTAMFCHGYGDNQVLFSGSRQHHRYVLCKGMAILKGVQRHFGIRDVSFLEPALYVFLYPVGLLRVLLGRVEVTQLLYGLLKIFLGRNGCEKEKKQEQNQQFFHYIKNIL